MSISPRCVSVCYGSWFDHIKDWTNQRRATSNLLHVTYEEMSLVKRSTARIAKSQLFFLSGLNVYCVGGVQDLSGTIQKVSSYLRRPLVEDEINRCTKHCSFSSMKVNKMVNYSLVANEIMDHSKGSFMRKGEALPSYPQT